MFTSMKNVGKVALLSAFSLFVLYGDSSAVTKQSYSVHCDALGGISHQGNVVAKISTADGHIYTYNVWCDSDVNNGFAPNPAVAGQQVPVIPLSAGKVLSTDVTVSIYLDKVAPDGTLSKVFTHHSPNGFVNASDVPATHPTANILYAPVHTILSIQ